MSRAPVEERGLGRQGMTAGTSRLRAGLEQRHRGRKVPLCGGLVWLEYRMPQECGIGWRERRSGIEGCLGHMRARVVRERSEEVLDWCAQLFLPAACLGPALHPCVRPPHPPVPQCFGCFVSSDRQGHAVHFTYHPASSPPPAIRTHVQVARQGFLSISIYLCMYVCMYLFI